MTLSARLQSIAHFIAAALLGTSLSAPSTVRAAAPVSGQEAMKAPPMVQVDAMPAAEYFPYAAELMKANPPQDAVDPLNIGDADGKPLNGANRYVLHFAKDEIPPVRAFWSVTLYDKDGFPSPNKMNRNAIGDRDPLKFNPDGSRDLCIQHESPGAEKESNWLPAPADSFNLTMRHYSPQGEVLDGPWAPPAVKKVR